MASFPEKSRTLGPEPPILPQIDPRDTPACVKSTHLCKMDVFLRVFSQVGWWGVPGEGGKGDRVNPIPQTGSNTSTKGRRITLRAGP